MPRQKAPSKALSWPSSSCISLVHAGDIYLFWIFRRASIFVAYLNSVIVIRFLVEEFNREYYILGTCADFAKEYLC